MLYTGSLNGPKFLKKKAVLYNDMMIFRVRHFPGASVKCRLFIRACVYLPTVIIFTLGRAEVSIITVKK